MAVFGPKLQFLKLRSATCESHSRPPPLSFSLKLCVVVLHTHGYHTPKFQPNPKHHDGVLIFAHFARAAACLLLACLLAAAAAAKPGRSTLATKKGYKTKTSSTSSVKITITLTLILTLTLTRVENWDRAGGGRSIVQDTSATNEVHTRRWMRAAQRGRLKMSHINPFGHHNRN